MAGFLPVNWLGTVSELNDEQMGQYQGELISKDKYTKMFIEAYNKRETNYALEKLTILLNNILEEAKHFL